MEEDFLEYINEEIRYIVTETSRERVETAKLRFMVACIDNLVILCVFMHMLKGIMPKEELLKDFGKRSLLCREEYYTGYFEKCNKELLVDIFIKYTQQMGSLEAFNLQIKISK